MQPIHSHDVQSPSSTSQASSTTCPTDATPTSTSPPTTSSGNSPNSAASSATPDERLHQPGGHDARPHPKGLTLCTT